MYKYLREKQDKAIGAFIESLIFVSNEYVFDRPSEVFEEFTELDKSEICKVLDWRDEEDVHESISNEMEGNLAWFMCKHERSGFLAKCCFPDTSRYKFNDKGETISYQVHTGICRVEWIYADTIHELIDKLVDQAKTIFDESVKEFIDGSKTED
ncbi:hypothetical protein HXZ91_04810 [Myroides odoratimimus]|uniref:hypothetical protein n=1 Tax=Myroides odoratimimus TaxID=76832 RepID=UPI0025792188|nr:hypothetical protein [Myroides odoratimimus]MDM1033799.1 hypothetical protein [Myroides odoratimimus]